MGINQGEEIYGTLTRYVNGGIFVIKELFDCCIKLGTSCLLVNYDAASLGYPFGLA